MNLKKLTLISAISAALFSTPSLYAGGGHDHGSEDHDDHAEEAEQAEGPHGGKLFTNGNVGLEFTIFEQGVDPEMRLYIYENGKAIVPEEAEVEVTLARLGGVSDNLHFSAEQDYLVSDQVIYEPHSYDVEISLSYEGNNHHWDFQSHEGRTEISDRLINRSGIKTETAGAKNLMFTDTLFGVIETPLDQIFRIHAPYSGIIEKVHVNIGDKVKTGQKLITLKNTQTLQTYSIKSPSDGQVTERMVNAGDLAANTPLLKIVDFSKVWVELSAFPESIEKLQAGQKVTVRDLHQHDVTQGTIEYVSPAMTGGHIARARAVIDNSDGHWRPGMHIKADVQTESKQAALAVKESALQSFRGMDVVFARFDNTFEVRMVELGKSDGEYIEVLGGLKPGTEYVTDNSFILKADVLKDGASHDH